VSRVEERPTRAGLAKAVFGSGLVGLIKPYEQRPIKGCKGAVTEKCMVGMSLLKDEQPSRSEGVTITNV